MKSRRPLIIISFLILLVVVFIYSILKPRNQGLYKVTILPTLDGDFTFPRSINDKGQVAGYSKTASGKSHLFLWDKESGIQDLGPVFSDNIFINNTNQIAANMLDPNSNNFRSFIWEPNTGRTILPTLGGKSSDVMGINNHGQVIGSSITSSGVRHAFIWDKINGIRDLTPTSPNDDYACSINDSGQVVVNEKMNILLVETDKEFKITSLQTMLWGGSPQIDNNGNITGMVRSTRNKNDYISWNSDSGQKTLFRSDLIYLHKRNAHNQLILTFGKEDTFLVRFHYFDFNNYMLDPKIGLISLDGYVPVRSRHDYLALKDINNEGCIIGAIHSTKSNKSTGILFEPIPEKMEQMSKKQIKQDNIVLE
jgi:probable HAF family extracellular repeat protein